MKKLEKIFDSKGFRYSQIQRNSNVALYRQEALKRKSSSSFYHQVAEGDEYYCYYEVIKIKRQKESKRIIDGVEILYEAKEVYPKDKEWGDHGWTFFSLREAEYYFIGKTGIKIEADLLQL